MLSVLSDFIFLGGWALFCLLLVWTALIRIWNRVIGERDIEANLIIMGLTILWAFALYSWV